MTKNKPLEDYTLRELQAYVQARAVERGFNTVEPSKKMVMLMEEVGELAKAIRKTVGMKFTDNTQQKDIAEELADVQLVLLGLAEILQVDMIEAFKMKEAQNQQRTWE